MEAVATSVAARLSIAAYGKRRRNPVCHGFAYGELLCRSRLEKCE
jgi:hypothetical protein